MTHLQRHACVGGERLPVCSELCRQQLIRATTAYDAGVRVTPRPIGWADVRVAYFMDINASVFNMRGMVRQDGDHAYSIDDARGDRCR